MQWAGSGRSDDVCILSHQDTRLSVIASDQNYRQNFTAADNSRSTNMETIQTIIDMIVCILSCPPTLPSQFPIKGHRHMNFELISVFIPSFRWTRQRIRYVCLLLEQLNPLVYVGINNPEEWIALLGLGNMADFLALNVFLPEFILLIISWNSPTAECFRCVFDQNRFKFLIFSHNQPIFFNLSSSV